MPKKAKKKATDAFTTPTGTLTGYVALQVPSQKYDTYTANISIPLDEGGDKLHGYLKKLRAYTLKKFEYDSPKDCHSPWETDDNNIIVKTKLKATIVSKKSGTIEKKINIFDSDAKLVKDLLNIGEGTVCKINVSPYLWETGSKCGITLQPNAVQIIELVEYEGGSGGNPFEKVDGSFKPGNSGVFDDDADFEDDETDEEYDKRMDEEEDDEDMPF